MKKSIHGTYFWNTLAGLLNAGQSFIYLLAITRICGIDEAGVFSFAFANSNLFLCIGKYGMRKYQATDVKGEYCFEDYFFSRVITTSAMMIGIIVYTFLYGNSTIKVILLILLGCLKAIDSFDDVFLGLFQQKKRLDIGAKNSCVRNFSTIIIFILLLIVTKNIYWSFFIGDLCSLILLVVLFNISKTNVLSNISLKINWKTIMGLLVKNAPLVLGDFLSFYIMNAPKYAIDATLSDQMQAYYGIISMPNLIIALLSDFVFNPLLVSFSESWYADKRKFIYLCLRQVLMIIVFTVFVMLFGALFGLSILGKLYQVNLIIYQQEFFVLLIGAGFVAISSFLYSLVAAIRKQKYVIPIYGIVAAIVFFVSNKFVSKEGLMGASAIYLIASTLITIMFTIILVCSMKESITATNSQNQL